MVTDRGTCFLPPRTLESSVASQTHPLTIMDRRSLRELDCWEAGTFCEDCN